MKNHIGRYHHHPILSSTYTHLITCLCVCVNTYKNIYIHTYTKERRERKGVRRELEQNKTKLTARKKTGETPNPQEILNLPVRHMALIIHVDKFDLVEWIRSLERRKTFSLAIKIFTRNLLGPKYIHWIDKSKPSLSLTGFPRNPLNKRGHSINGPGKQGWKTTIKNSCGYWHHDKILPSCADEDRKVKKYRKEENLRWRQPAIVMGVRSFGKHTGGSLRFVNFRLKFAHGGTHL